MVRHPRRQGLCKQPLLCSCKCESSQKQTEFWSSGGAVLEFLLITTHSTTAWMECRNQETPDAEGSGLLDQSAADRPECQEQCRLETGCNAVAWDRNDLKCYMKQGFDLAAVVTWNTNDGFDFCWQVSQGCPMQVPCSMSARP